jgi:hypothetical protein
MDKKKKGSKPRYKKYKRVPDGVDIAEAKPEVVRILIDAFNVDMNVTQACHQAGISRDTYYEWIKKDPVLSDRFEKAQTSTKRLAKSTLRMKLQKEHEELKTNDNADIPTTRWWSERRMKDEFSTKTENDNRNTNIDISDIRELFDEDLDDSGECYEPVT